MESRGVRRCKDLIPWALEQIIDAYLGITKLAAPTGRSLFAFNGQLPVDRLSISPGPAQSLPIQSGSLKVITVDPPYYNNVNYAELADFFYAWQQRNLGPLYPGFFSDDLTPKDDEATANPARFQSLAER